MNRSAPTFHSFCSRLRRTMPEHRIVTDVFRTAAYGADASFYRLRPAVVVTVESDAEVIAVLEAARGEDVSVTFRAAGTSLSGQAVTDSVLARLGDGWDRVEVLEGGARVRLGPGVIGAVANRALAPFGRKLGPDPASMNAAMIGGIAANNASGMCCGTDQNSYRTVESMRVIFADGTVLDTGDPASVADFRKGRADLVAGLTALRDEVTANPELRARIERKFSIKNTTGYSLNALTDFEGPIDILQHLMIGSEGTLGFISDITYRTVPDPKHKAAALAFYETPRLAAEAVMAMKSSPAAAIELIDRAGIRSAEGKPGMPTFLAELGPEATALLVEVQAHTVEALREGVEATRAAMAAFPTVQPVQFSEDPKVCAVYWAVRKGLFPAVGALRETGTTVIIEDVAFPIQHLGDGVAALQELFTRHGYDDAILFGHARDGNLHVVFSQDFRNRAEVDRYAKFMDELCEMVVNRFDGSLKAEHGTGRNVAPFVELEWGRDALSLMRRIKDLFDPRGILNPGVILNDDPEAHLANLKDLPAAHPVVDKCTECGFCESHCPSHGLTTSPRQRTVSWRFINDEKNDPEAVEAVQARFGYQTLDTCATCGLCATVCPVGIDTGELVRQLRGGRRAPSADGWADWVANHFGTVTDAAGLGLRAGALARALFGSTTTEVLSGAASAMTGGAIPKWSRAVPTGYRFEPADPKLGLAPGSGPVRELVVYLPSCAARTMRPVTDGDRFEDPLPVVVERLAARAGVGLVYPAHLSDLCCGKPFESKGLIDQADRMSRELFDAVRAASGGTKVKVLSDTSPCSYRLDRLRPHDIEVVDLVEFLHDRVLPHLELEPWRNKLAVHATCSIMKMGLTPKLMALASACAEEIITPEKVECCGFAGDRGFTNPELNDHALRHLPAAVEGAGAGCSSSVTCEIGLARASRIPYRSIAYFLDEVAEDARAGDRED